MGTIVAGLAATAFTVGGTSVTYGGLLTLAALGTSTAAALNQPDFKQSERVANIADKTVPQQAEQLDPAELGGDSEKRKRQSAKSRFKVEREPGAVAPAESGVSFEPTQRVTGVQI